MELQGVEQNLELIPGVCAHLTRELESQYPSRISRKGSKIHNSSLESAYWDGDEIKVSLTEKNKQFHVRMVLPLLEENGYSLTVCSCLEDRYLDDQRCSHMWFAQNYILEKLSSTQKTIDADKAPWLSLIEMMNEFDNGQDANVATGKNPDSHELIWILNDDLTLFPGIKSRSAQGCDQKDWSFFFRNRQFWWDSLRDLQIYCFFQEKKSLGHAGSDIEHLTYDLLDILCRHQSQILLKNSASYFELKRSELSFRLSLSEGGLILEPFIPGSLSSQIVLGHQDSSGGFVVDRKQQTIFVINLSAENKSILSFLTRHGDQGFFPAQMRREYCVTLSTMQSLKRIDYQDTCSEVLASDSGGNLYFRLTPVEPEGVFLEAFIKPISSLAYHKFYQVPGEGNRVLSDFSQFPPVTVKRSFDHESELFQQIVSELSINSDSFTASKKLHIRNDYDVIEFLDELQSHPLKSSIFLEWPEEINGTPGKFRFEDEDENESPKLKLSAQKSDDWFDIAGGVWLNGQHIDLLTLVKAYQAKRKFIKLASGKWYRISELLEHRIAQIEACLNQGGNWHPQDHLKMNPTQAALSMQIPGLELSGDTGLDDLRYRVQAAVSEAPSLPEGFRAELRAYQKEGFIWLWRLSSWASGAILADDMGLGKTVQTIAFLKSVYRDKPVLILCPSSLCDNWVQEINKFCPQFQTKLFREHRNDLLISDASDRPLVVISSYGLILHDETNRLTDINWGVVVLDEAQALKNSRGKTYRKVARLSSDFTLALSGTPVENNLSDLWSLFNLVIPGLLGSKPNFQKKWQEISEAGSKACGDASSEFKKLVRPFILRRTKEAYLKDLPPKTWKSLGVYLSSEERKFYDEKRMQAIAELKSAEADQDAAQTQKIQILDWLTKLRQIVCHPALVEPDWTGGSAKEKEFFCLAEKLMKAGQKTLVFSQFPSFLMRLQKGIEEKGWKTQMLRGSTPVGVRQELVRVFQNGGIDFFLISLKAGGTGLNLTRAESVILMDPWWNPAAESQAADRAYRIGQKNPVTIFRMVAQNTIEEKVLNLQEAKKKLSEEFIDSDGGDLNHLRELIGLSE